MSMHIKLWPDREIRVEKKRVGRVPVLILRPTQSEAGKPGVLWIHGGGYITGMKEMVYMSRAADLVKKFGVTVVSPGYRLAWLHPWPAAAEDCFTVLQFMDENREQLGFSSLMVGGESAGGGLTAALCMYARDKGSVNIAYQMPLYPMLDDRDTESSRDNHAPIWNTKRNHAAWKLYLKGLTEIPPYAAPARQTDYSNLPPTYTFVGDIEPFYCETLTYIENLKAAGVEASVDVYPNWFHAYDMFFPFKAMAKQAIAKFEEQFCYAAEHYFAPQNKE